MPSERFYKLKPEKKEKIRRAAIDEFARVTPDNVSINRIIKAANISRGSFYTYFVDKSDLALFLFVDFSKRFKEYILSTIKEGKGDLIYLFEKLFDITIKSKNAPEAQCYGKIFSEALFSFGKYDRITNPVNGFRDIHERRKEFEAYSRILYKEINHELYDVDEYEFHQLLELLFLVTVQSVIKALNNSEIEKRAKSDLMIQLKFIEKGIVRTSARTEKIKVACRN